MVEHIGEQFGDYRLIRPLGSGAFARVYMGERLSLGLHMVIKVLDFQLTEERVEAFQTEARRLTWLRHPNIIKIRDAGVKAGIPFLVIDYAPNGTLRQRHPIGKMLSPQTILPYVKQVADALAYAHSENVVHCDIKPENLLIGSNNEVMLGDFSMALVAHASDSPMPQGIAGTVNYMAPEQFQSNPRPASDQYALAVVIYEWLCGEPPFQGSFTQIATGHLFGEPAPLRDKAPDLSTALERVILTALSKNPNERYPSIQAFAKAFEHACAATPTFHPSGLQLPPSPAGAPAEEEAPPAESVSLAPLVVKVAGSTNPSSSHRTRIFISYSHKDLHHLERLKTHLQYAIKGEMIDQWDDMRIVPGADWRKEIRHAIESANFAILLVSADFLASEFITTNELPPLIDAAHQEGTSILPVIIGPCAFEDEPIARFQFINNPAKPLMGMKPVDRDKIWAKVAKLVTLRAVSGK